MRLEKIEDAWTTFEQAQAVLNLLVPNPDRDNETTEFDDNYFKLVSRAKRIILEIESRNASQVTNANEALTATQNNRIAQL